jgi:hypothetical protein
MSSPAQVQQALHDGNIGALKFDPTNGKFVPANNGPREGIQLRGMDKFFFFQLLDVGTSQFCTGKNEPLLFILVFSNSRIFKAKYIPAKFNASILQ